MKINLKDRTQSQSQCGMALIEVLLAVLLVSVVIGVAMAIFSQGQLTYTKGQDKVDAQSQLRIAMNNIKRELSVATNVEIAGSTGSFEEGICYFYIDGNALTLNASVLEDGVLVSKIRQVSQPLPSLAVTFSISPLDTNNRMLRVQLETIEGAELYSDVLVQNTTSGISGLTEGSVLIFESIE